MSFYTSTKDRFSYQENKGDPKYIVKICVLFLVLLWGRAINGNFFYIMAGLSFLVFVMSNTVHCFYFLLFLLPFSTIMKHDVDSISFFTVLFFFTVCRMVLDEMEFDSSVFAWSFFFIFYGLVFSGFGEITTLATMSAGMMMISLIQNKPIELDLTILSFSAGICFASIFGLMKKSLPVVTVFVADTVQKLGEGNYASRFSGLQGNPNYFTLDIVIAISVIIVAMYGQKQNRFYEICVIALSVFGLLSVSKSFLITWVLLIFCWFILSIKQGIDKMAKFIFIAVIMIAVVYFFAYDSVNTYLFRFTEDSSGTLRSITTGRSEIWKRYIDILLSDLKILLFGNGLNTIATIGKGTHNTYLESLFSLGIVGTTIFLAAIKSSMGKIITNNLMRIPLVILCIRMFAVGILTYDNLWFYLAVFSILAKECANSPMVGSKE